MLLECVPNVSEGRRTDVIGMLTASLRSVAGVRVLDVSSDPSHNRSVFTLAGESAGLADAVLALFDRAIATIDLRHHRGEHPRIGAVDVVPFVPIGRARMDDCIAIARTVGARVAERFEVPVYLYAAASDHPARRHLEDIRRGGLEGVAARMAQPDWAPDFGPCAPHPSAGVSVIGARPPLIAYNINLATDRLDVARDIAAAVQSSGGGLPHLKAMGVSLADRGIVQVSMNLTNYTQTPLRLVFDAVEKEAARRGVAILESEIVGLAPAAALAGIAGPVVRLKGSVAEKMLEPRLASG